MATMLQQPQNVLTFWFEEIAPQQWWMKSPDFDQLIAHRFGALHCSVASCEMFAWRETPQGRLAEIIVLDQFSRNIYRDQPQAYAHDALALALAQTAVELEVDKAMSAKMKQFLYMPFMHSESLAIHAVALKLFAATGLEKSLQSELKHQAIIERFGRYPHRNQHLGRQSSPQELEFLAQPHSSF